MAAWKFVIGHLVCVAAFFCVVIWLAMQDKTDD